MKAVGGWAVTGGWGVGGYWRLEMRLGLVLGYGNAFWGRVRAVGRGEGVPPLSSDALGGGQRGKEPETHRWQALIVGI